MLSISPLFAHFFPAPPYQVGVLLIRRRGRCCLEKEAGSPLCLVVSEGQSWDRGVGACNATPPALGHVPCGPARFHGWKLLSSGYLEADENIVGERSHSILFCLLAFLFRLNLSSLFLSEEIRFCTTW